MVQIDFSQMPGARPSAGKIDFSQMPKSQANPIATANVLGSPDFQSSKPQSGNAIPPMQSDNFLGRFGEALSYFPKGVYETAKGLGKGAVQGSVNLENMARGAVRDTGLSNRQDVQMPQWAQPQGQIQGAFEPLGEAIPATAAMALVPQVGLAGKGAQALNFLSKSALGTGLVTGSTEGRLPTGKELAAYGALDVLLGGLGKAGSNFYQSAFKGTQKQEADTLKRFGKTIGQIAEELKVPAGTARGIAENRAKELPKIWKRLEKVADKTLPAQTKAFKNIANIIASRLTKDLPSSQAKKELSRAVIDKVMFYAPTKKATGREILGIIKNLNKGLFGSGDKSVLNFKQLSSVENKLKGELKNLLPKEAKDIYKNYSQNKLIQDVMSNEAVRKTLGREIAGASTGIQAGAFMGADPISAVIGGLAGKYGAKGATSTALKTYGGKAIKALNSPVAKTLLKTLGIKLSKD